MRFPRRPSVVFPRRPNGVFPRRPRAVFPRRPRAVFPSWRPWAVDILVTALAFAISMVALDGREDVTGLQTGTGELVATVVTCLPLLWRRRAPVVVFACTAVLAWADDLGRTDVPAAMFAPLFAVYAVARYRPRAWLWTVAAVFEVSLLITMLRQNTLPQDMTAASALLAAVVFLGLNLRTRRAYLDQLEERAARLERERDQQARLATAAERARIARELHDIVAHNLVVMVALADGAAATAPTAPDRAADAMAKVAATGRLALVEMRRMVGVLKTDPQSGVSPVMPSPLPSSPPSAESGVSSESAARSAQPGLPPTSDARSPQPGLDDVDPLIERVRAAGMRVELTRSGEPGAWGPGADLAVYRIVQEALTNALKHAGPRAVARVRLGYTADGADIEVVDDGAGRQAQATVAPDRHGLAGMAERTASFGGRLEAGPRAGAGWRIRARLRFEAEGSA